MESAIIFVLNGFVEDEDMEKHALPLEKIIINKFTNIPCFRAFLDDEIRRKKFLKDGSFIDDIDSCLNLLISKKVKRVYLIPVIPLQNQLYKLIESKCNLYKKSFFDISIAKIDENRYKSYIEIVESGKILVNNIEYYKALVEATENIIKRKR
ncbi:MAG: hypothetical protein ACRDA4_05860 [Filifactoraceae bacterium]